MIAKITTSGLNIGIAGHKNYAIGSLHLANRIEDADSGKCWYPQIVIDTDIQSTGLLSLSQPCTDYCEQMYDMEAAGFYNSVSLFATAELCHSIKLISDNEQNPAGTLDRQSASALLADKLTPISQLMDALTQLARELDYPEIADHLAAFASRWHFTHYQRPIDCNDCSSAGRSCCPTAIPLLSHPALPGGETCYRYWNNSLIPPRPPMFERIYIEDAVCKHPRTQNILRRFPRAARIPCTRYTEIFNRKAQNFRLQKKQPALILAEKFRRHLLPAPVEYNIGAQHNYYFSHMLNCLYDCRYCFLQGMYRSAHYVLYVNYDDFTSAITRKIKQHAGETIHFFSGYDCDSLALEPLSGFARHFLPYFDRRPDAWLELRTKSTQIRPLLEHGPIANCVVAYSLSPQSIITALEHKTPRLDKRLDALRQLQQQGWLVGLRFDPLIYQDDFQKVYRDFFAQVLSADQYRAAPFRQHGQLSTAKRISSHDDTAISARATVCSGL